MHALSMNVSDNITARLLLHRLLQRKQSRVAVVDHGYGKQGIRFIINLVVFNRMLQMILHMPSYTFTILKTLSIFE